MGIRTKRLERLFLIAGVALLLGVGRVEAGGGDKVAICHVPPGDPGNVQLITVAPQAVPAHVANHGDAACPDGDSDCCVDSAGMATCTNLQSDPANCGACGQACDATAMCDAGQCVTQQQDQGACDVSMPCTDSIPCQDNPNCNSWVRADGAGCFCGTRIDCFDILECGPGNTCPNGMTCVSNCCGPAVCEGPCQ
jgi:hypothetical protein